MFSLFGTAGAEERKTIPIRKGDNVSALLQANGVSQRALLELIAWPEIAPILDSVRPGHTLELIVDAGRLVGLELHQPGKSVFSASADDIVGWQFSDQALLPDDAVAGRIRRMEAGGFGQRIAGLRGELVASEDKRGGAQALMRAERALHPRVVAARRSAAPKRARHQKSPPPPRESKPSWDTPTPSSPAILSAARESQGIAPSSQGKQIVSKASQDAARVTKVASNSQLQSKAPTQVARARAQLPALPVAKPRKTAPSVSAASRVTPTALVPKATPAKAVIANARVQQASTPQTPSAKVALANKMALASPSVQNCPSIEGAWRASYAYFDCEAKLSFAKIGPGKYQMTQDGCGDIAGRVSQDGTSVSGRWRHSICKGVLNVTLDPSCNTGSGTWQASAGRALCSEKEYAVAITRGPKKAAAAVSASAVSSSRDAPLEWLNSESAGDQ